MSEVIHEEASPSTSITIDEDEVDQIKETILEAQYFDANGMAALTPASLVSIPRLVNRHDVELSSLMKRRLLLPG